MKSNHILLYYNRTIDGPMDVFRKEAAVVPLRGERGPSALGEGHGGQQDGQDRAKG